MASRYRSASEPGYSYYYNAYSSTTGAPEYALPGLYRVSPSVKTLEESMVDVSGPRRPGMHPCRHYKRTFSGTSGFSPWCPKPDGYGGTTSGGQHSNVYIWNTAMAPNVVDVYKTPLYRYGTFDSPFNGLPVLSSYVPGNLQDLINRALWAMVPGIKPAGGLSLLNSIYELKDFRTLPRTLDRVRALYARLSKGKYTNKTLKQLARTTSDVYLQEEFNVKPLLSDVSGLITALFDVRNELKRLVKEAGKPLKRHFRCQLDLLTAGSDSASVQGSSPSYTTTTWTCLRRHSYGVQEFNATLEYSYLLPSWVSEDSLIAALLDRMGINLNPTIIWNAVPWSFVVDWVISVNKWLDQFKHRVIEPIVTIRGACYSFKIERRIYCELRNNQGASANTSTFESVYNRDLIPNLYNSLEASGLSVKEFGLATALASSRWH